MNRQPSFRDLTELSAYLDGELNASAHQRMKDRLARDPELAAALDDLRLSRAVLRRTPQRRAPRHFTLSPQMVAKRPPMPRLVPALNYASLAAMLLFLFSFLGPIGLGDSAAPEQEMMAAAPMAMEESAMEMAAAPVAADSTMEEEAPAVAMPAAEAPAEETGENLASAPLPEATAEGIQTEKTFVATPSPEPTIVPTAEPTPRSSPEAISLLTAYQRTLVILLGSFGIFGWVLRRMTVAKWQKKSK